MRKLFLCSLALIAVVSSCNFPTSFSSLAGFLGRPDGQKGSSALVFDDACYSDSTVYAYLNAELNFPVATNEASKTMRKELLEIFKEQMQSTGFEQEYKLSINIKDSQNAEDILSILCPETFALLTDESEKDFKDRISDIKPENFDNEEEYLNIIENVPTWESEISLTMSRETDSYVVFISNNYVYYGGAHGGITGAGSLTFDKKTGKLFTDFISKDKEEALQPLLRQGMKEYLSEVDDTMDFEEETILLPEWAPEPTEEGLCFTYQQYEIGPYALGMPSFTIPYEKIKPYLTDKAKTLLGL